jgi:hypothetical protein
MAAFSYWTATTRLLSARCPDCERRTTMTAETLRHWHDESQ